MSGISAAAAVSYPKEEGGYHWAMASGEGVVRIGIFPEGPAGVWIVNAWIGVSSWTLAAGPLVCSN
ncbi:hypothetical protein N7462_009911 [Penicillium macrosclerotiorum]|uniref:uncharacterized protein n=1 Tax=Penicillium macrosclerotiorum TaxID=303699 RepID=UPI0025475530|nr:uncharacterized protein N7462_009911 [Penicillium macrosclerotiorum]KAJ5668841.1 hypothetical protein N7462_009911 [Penicillium macrosclerotiorum]